MSKRKNKYDSSDEEKSQYSDQSDQKDKQILKISDKNYNSKRQDISK